MQKSVRAWGDEAFGLVLKSHGVRALGERGVVSPMAEIGGHPDYNHLEVGQMELGHITTLFVDMNKYTSRTLVMKDDPVELKEIVLTKSDLITALVRFVQMGGGHVHSITGDGVMALFGRVSDDTPLVGIGKALMTSVAILHYTREWLNPLLEDQGREGVKIRTGLDFSPVHWIRMGINGYTEVKAVGYGVDMAAKLLSPSRAWRSRAGETLYDMLPSGLQRYLRPIDPEEDGHDEVPVFTTQYKNKKVEYKKYLFEWEQVLKESKGDVDNAVALLGAAGQTTISIPRVNVSTVKTVDDDSVVFG